MSATFPAKAKDNRESKQQSTNIAKWRGGGAKGRKNTMRDEDNQTTIKQIMRRGG